MGRSDFLKDHSSSITIPHFCIRIHRPNSGYPKVSAGGRYKATLAWHLKNWMGCRYVTSSHSLQHGLYRWTFIRYSSLPLKQAISMLRRDVDSVKKVRDEWSQSFCQALHDPSGYAPRTQRIRNRLRIEQIKLGTMQQCLEWHLKEEKRERTTTGVDKIE